MVLCYGRSSRPIVTKLHNLLRGLCRWRRRPNQGGFRGWSALSDSVQEMTTRLMFTDGLSKTRTDEEVGIYVAPTKKNELLFSTDKGGDGGPQVPSCGTPADVRGANFRLRQYLRDRIFHRFRGFRSA